MKSKLMGRSSDIGINIEQLSDESFVLSSLSDGSSSISEVVISRLEKDLTYNGAYTIQNTEFSLIDM